MPVDKLFDLSGRTALVTGGSKGLGKAMAIALAEAGANLAICSRHDDELQAAKTEIQASTRSKVATIVADLARPGEASRLAQAALGEMGRIDILINNAGTNVPRPIDEIRDEDWQSLLQLNLTSCMELSRALVPQMKQRRWGRIIHISSVMGLASKAGRANYSATKSALLGLARGSALDLGSYGITVNCIAPGPFWTDLPASVFSEEQMKAVASRTALNRWGQPHELAGPVLLLASEAGSYITGAALVVDGGALSITM